MTDALVRLQSVLGHEDLRWLVERLIARLETGKALGGRTTLKNPTPPQRRAADRLLSRPPSGGESVTVDLDELEQRLRDAKLANSLSDAVQLLVGPVTNRREQQRQWQQSLAGLLDIARERLAQHPNYSSIGPYLEEPRTVALIKRFSQTDRDRAATLLEQLVQLLEQIPSDGCSIAELASRLFGDSHALDRGRPLATLATAALAAIAGSSSTPDRLEQRELWAQVGVSWDTLSTPVLTLNFVARGDCFTRRQLALHHAACEPARLSVRQLQRDLPELEFEVPHGVVFACENPAIVAAAAERLGAESAPLLCLEGQPKTAARLLLSAVRAQGYTLRYHGDFDWAGVAITNLMVREYQADPWRMNSRDYCDAPTGVSLSDEWVEPIWDAELAPAMVERGCAIHEESVVETLLRDLRLSR